MAKAVTFDLLSPVINRIGTCHDGTGITARDLTDAERIHASVRQLGHSCREPACYAIMHRVRHVERVKKDRYRADPEACKLCERIITLLREAIEFISGALNLRPLANAG